MLQNITICDGCQKSIDTSKGYFSLEPLRGGLNLRVSNGTNDAGTQIANRQDYHDETCFALVVAKVRSAIKATPAPANKPVAPQAPVATPATATPQTTTPAATK